MDESLFFKRKYNRGRINDGFWVVGGIERETKRAFIQRVESRDASTMRRVINDNIYPNSIVITDEWRAYASALTHENEMVHLTVNHSIHFVSPDNPLIHTQKHRESMFPFKVVFEKKKKNHIS